MALPNGTSFTEAMVEISTDGSDWTDISDAAVAVDPGGGDRQNEDEYVFGEDYALTTYGKREPIELMVRAVYTEGAGDVFEVVRAAYEAKTDFYVRYSPKGGATADFLYATPAGKVINAPWPGGEAGDASPILFEFTVKASHLTKSAVA